MASTDELRRRREKARERKHKTSKARRQAKRMRAPKGKARKVLQRLRAILRRLWHRTKARIRKLTRRIKDRRRPDPGEGPWGGSQSVAEQAVRDVCKRFGVSVTSRKRAADHPLSIKNPSSDHNAANGSAYAWDIGTYDGSAIAHAIAAKLGIGGYTTGNYAFYYVTRSGHAFRVQILWAVSGHFDHVHAGVRRA